MTGNTRHSMIKTHTRARIGLVSVLLAALSFSAQAQTPSQPSRGISPVGAYSISDLETVNLTNGNVNLSIPLASLPPIAGGKLSLSLSAAYNSKLWDRTSVDFPPNPPASGYTEYTLQVGDTGGWRIGAAYQLTLHSVEEGHAGVPPVDSGDPEWWLTGYRWKMVLTTPDGAKHELRPTDYLSYPGNLDYRRGYFKDTPRSDSVNATMRYYSYDGSYVWAKIDPYPVGGGPTSWVVYLPDGATIEQSGGIQRIKDTNGNKIKIFTDVAGTITTTHYQDELTGREIKYLHNSATNTGQVQYQTVGGSWISIDVNWGTTHVHGLTYLKGDICLSEGEVNTDITVIRSIVYPLTKPGAPRLQFTFSYNSDTNDSISLTRRLPNCAGTTTITSASHGWGSLSQVVTPQGATVNYDYELDGAHEVFFDSQRAPREPIKQKTLIHDGVTDVWDYTIAFESGEVKGPDGSITTETAYPHDPALAGYLGGLDGKGGLVYRTERKLGPVSNPVKQITVERHWTKLVFSGANEAAPGGLLGFNLVVDAEYTTLHNSSGVATKMSAKTFQRDYNGNVTQTTEYDWFDPGLVSRDTAGIPTGVPAGATVLRTTTTNFYNPATASTSANVYAKRTLPSGSPLILNALQQTTAGASQTQFSYDNFAYGQAPTLGNLTRVSAWDDQAGAWRNTTHTYNSSGNKISTIDPKVNATSFHYDTAPYVSPTRIVVDPLNGTGQQTTTFVYDSATERVTSQTDPNGKTTTIDYTNHLLGAVDPYARPGVVSGPAVNSVVNGVTYANQRHRVKTTYDDNTRQVTVETDLNQEDDKKLKGRTTSDQLGRGILAERNEDGTANYTISSQTVYLQMGKITLASNPKRSASATADGWTRTTRDDLGRVTELATFSGATQPPSAGTNSNWTGNVTTGYNVNQTTVTDQAGKARRSETDALGRLTKVTEDPSALNYETTYFYDSLNNLRYVGQGAQGRWFAYDSLSRLIRAKNPEQDTNFSLPPYTDPLTGGNGWSMAYSYDANGNLLSKTDARNLTTSYGYDGLNRNTTVNYSDSTPDVTRTYDTAPTLGKGRLHKTETAGGAAMRVTINSYDAMGRPLSQSQQFYHLGAWGSSYTTQHAYNLAGGVTLQTYPSNRTATTNYDMAGRVNTFSGNLGDGVNRNYVTGTTVYTATGQMTQERFGTTTTLYHRRHFNSRGQMYDVRLGTGAADDFSNATWNRGALRNYFSSDYTLGNGGVNINGNVYRQDHFVPLSDTVGDWVMSADYFAYDALNRITLISEAADSYIGGVFQETYPYAQHFNYDRYGNRTLGLATTGAASGPGATFIKDTVWVEDALPAGATPGFDGGDNWTWVSGNPAPVSGSLAHQSNISAGQHQHFFTGATATLQVNTGDKLYAYVYLDPSNLPSEVMLQWNENGSWEHRAYWGANLIAYGVDGTVSRRNMGSLPPNGGWMRLEVAASLVGLEGKTLNGMAFTLYGGRATWDRGGKSAQPGGAINNRPFNVETARNRLLAVSGAMQYDAAGNLSYDNYTTPLQGQRAYDAENRMTEVRSNTGVLQHSYFYDGDGRRARRVINSVETWQIYGIGGELVAEYAAGGATNAPQKEYGYRGGQLLITAESNGTVKWLVGDQLGTPRMVVDKSGALNGASGIVRHDYLPFGEEISAGVGIRSAPYGYGTDNVRQKFDGYERDNETGLDYAQARYFSSIQGRFTSADPLFIEVKRYPYPQSWNLYAHTRNNPLKYVDPDGLDIKVTCADGKLCDETVANLNNRKGAQFKTELKDGKLAIVGKVDASKLDKSERQLYNAITDTKNTAEIEVRTGSPGIEFAQYVKPGLNIIDAADVRQLNKVDQRLSGEVIAHEALEAYAGVAEGKSTYTEAHRRANEFFGNAVITSIEAVPKGANPASSGQATYNFRRLGVQVTYQKLFVTPQPAESLPNNWERIRGNLRVIPPK